MVRCWCDCHQMPKLKSNCGNCDNTGIRIFDTHRNVLLKDFPVNLEDKPFYKKDGTEIVLTKSQKKSLSDARLNILK